MTISVLSGLFHVEFGLGSQRHNAVSSLELHPGLSAEEKVPQDCFKFRSTAGLLISGDGVGMLSTIFVYMCLK